MRAFQVPAPGKSFELVHREIPKVTDERARTAPAVAGRLVADVTRMAGDAIAPFLDRCVDTGIAA